MPRLASVLLALLLAVSVAAADRPTDAEIRKLVADNMAATEAIDSKAILATIHPDALGRSSIVQTVEGLKEYKLKYEARSVEFVTMVGEYALVRVVQRTTRVSGPAFMDNEIDGVWALRRAGSKWKYWSQMPLDVRSLK